MCDYYWARRWVDETIDEIETKEEFTDQDIQRYYDLANYLKNRFPRMAKELFAILED